MTQDFAVESQLAAIKHSYTNSSLASPPLSSLNFQIPVQTPNSYKLALEEMQKLLASSSTCSMCPSSNSSGRGIVNAFHLGQSYESQQKNLEVREGNFIIDNHVSMLLLVSIEVYQYFEVANALMVWTHFSFR